MNSLIFLAGLAIAALFAIFADGAAAGAPNKPADWIETVFWTIIVLSAVPLVGELALIHYRDLRSKQAKRKQRKRILSRSERTLA